MSQRKASMQYARVYSNQTYPVHASTVIKYKYSWEYSNTYRIRAYIPSARRTNNTVFKLNILFTYVGHSKAIQGTVMTVLPFRAGPRAKQRFRAGHGG